LLRAVSALLVGAVACSSSSAAHGGSAAPTSYDVVVSAPLTSAPWVGTAIQRGAQLAVDQVNAAGGVGTGHARLKLVVLDNAGSPRTALANARQAVGSHAAALITDGTGAAALANVSDPASLPVFDVFDGGASIIDPRRRPTLFRIAFDHAMGTRLADYLAARHPTVAVLSDDSSYGRDGAAALRAGSRVINIRISATPVVPVNASAVNTQVLAARRSVRRCSSSGPAHPWSRHGAGARSTGWNVPIFTGPTGEDPLVRRQLADHRDWVNGVGFVSFRITAEVGRSPTTSSGRRMRSASASSGSACRTAAPT